MQTESRERRFNLAGFEYEAIILHSASSPRLSAKVFTAIFCMNRIVNPNAEEVLDDEEDTFAIGGMRDEFHSEPAKGWLVHPLPNEEVGTLLELLRESCIVVVPHSMLSTSGGEASLEVSVKGISISLSWRGGFPTGWRGLDSFFDSLDELETKYLK